MPTAKQFGARYGRKPKAKFHQIQVLQRAKQRCPSCQKDQVKRVATGIWQCRKCSVKFTGKAYTAH